MAKRLFRGVERRQELSTRNEWRDIRGFGEKVREHFEAGDAIVFVGLGAAAIMWMFPMLMELAWAAALLILVGASRSKFSLPFRMPETSRLIDPNNPHPADGRAQPAEGICFLGNDIQTDKELWFNGDDMKTHVLVFGSTGAGKTEALLSIAYNCLVQGSGFIYVDGKGDNSLWEKVFSIARSLGRDDDLLIINYMTGGRDVFGPQENKLSNTLNPFIKGSAGGLTEMLIGLMDAGGGDNAMWEGRAQSLVSSIMFALVYLRDFGGLLLDVDVLREHLILDNIQKLSKRRDLPDNVRSPIIAYLRSLPGYKENAPGGQQSETAMDQHGYLQMQFTKILGSLSDSYGYIFKTNLGEVDFVDVVVNRRILVVLLPAMEKSPAELGNLGKIIVAGIKQMMATGLGDRLEGTRSEVIEVKPTTSPSPFMCILDEYGYYVVKGASVMPAQARSLGFCMIFAGQDYPAFKKNNMQEEAVSTIGNCNIKIFMKTEDPTETAELFQKSVGQALVSRTSGFSQNQGLLSSSYMDQNNASIEKRDRGDILDLKAQGPGEAHIIFKDTLVRARMFYAAPDPVPVLRVNSFLRVEPPEREDMAEIEAQLKELHKRLSDPDLALEQIEEDGAETPSRVKLFAEAIAQAEQEGADAACAGMAGLATVGRNAYANLDAFGKNADDLGQAPGNLDIFGNEDDFGDDDEEDDEDEDGDEDGDYRVMMEQAQVRQRLADLEVAAGAKPDAAKAQADKLAEDMQAVSSYPQHVPDPADPNDIVNIIQGIDEGLD